MSEIHNNDAGWNAIAGVATFIGLLALVSFLLDCSGVGA